MTSISPRTSGRNDAIDALVRNVVDTRYEDLSQGAVDATKTFILDAFGVAIVGTLAPGVPETLGLLSDWGGKEESTVLVSGERLPAPSSAMMNSFLMHNQEFDPVHDLAVVHAFTTVLPVALAVAEAHGGVTGKELLTAVALGVDVACWIGISSRSPIAHFRPGTLGAFGAVAAAGKITGMDQATLTHAMGIVYSQISGTLQPHTEGVQVNSMQTGFNARGAVTAISLAARRIQGPAEVLEGRYGYFPLFEGEYDVEDLLANLGRVWQVERIGHKPFPSGRLTHGAAEAVLTLKERHGFKAEDIKDIEALVPPLVYRLVGRPLGSGTPSLQYAKLCIPFVAAVALLRDTVFIHDFGAEGLRDPAVHELASRITAVEDLTITDQNIMVPQTLRIRLNDGTEHALTLDQLLGHPVRPLNRDQHLEKFHACWVAGASHLPEGNRDRLAELVDGLEDAPSVEEIIRLLVP
jgi:2-methylcitrate dehydratase PrpD